MIIKTIEGNRHSKLDINMSNLFLINVQHIICTGYVLYILDKMYNLLL